MIACAAPPDDGPEGEWLGSLHIDGSVHQVHLTLRGRDDHLAGSVDLPSMSAFGTPLERISVDDAMMDISFTKSSGTWSAGAWRLACKRERDRLACEATHDRLHARFELSRVALRAADATMAERFAGYYDRGGEALILARAGSHLLRTDGGLPAELYPLSDGTFTTDGAEIVTFEVDSSARVLAAHTGVGAQRARATRVELPYSTREITFASGAVTLRGTLRAPRGGGAHPGVVLVHGSAPGEGYQPYLEGIADHFARHGVAVFAYDKRGWGLSGGDWRAASFDDLAGDALAALSAMKRAPEVDARRVGMWGISQAGWLLPMAASREPDVAFLILASAAAVSPAEQERSRVEHEMRADGLGQPLIDEALAFEQLFIDVALHKAGREDLERAMRDAAGKPWARYPAVLQVSASPSAVDAVLRIAAEARDPAAALRRVSCPVLAIYGELDQAVRVDENRRRLEEALRAGGNADVTTVVVRGADHAFFPSRTGGREELLKSGSHRIVFAPGFLQQMTDWVIGRVTPGRRAG